MGLTDDERRTVRIALIVLGVVAFAGLVVAALVVWWIVKSPPTAAPPPPGVVNMDEHPSAAWTKYVEEIRESAERNEASLAARPDDRLRVRPEDGHMLVGGPGPFAEEVDRLVRERIAIDVVEAYFRGDPPSVAETSRLRAALDRRQLSKLRERLGPVVAGRPHASGTRGRWGETVEGYVDLDVTSASGLAAAVEADLVYAGRGAWQVDDLAVVPYPPGKARTVPRIGAVRDWIEREHCAECGAIRWTKRDGPWHVVPGRKDHEHKWTSGAGQSLLEPVPEGVVVLVSRPPVVAGFILRRARAAEWNRCDYDWALRDDGGASLDPADPAVRSGRASQAKHIDMGGVRVGWSLNADGKIWLAYPRQAGETIADEDPRICRTDAGAFGDVDPADPRLRFRASPSDEGTALPEK
jgi:hypothetical protein